MLNRKHFTAIVVIAAVAVVVASALSLMGVTAQESHIQRVNDVQYDAIVPLTVDMKPGENKTVPIEIKARSALTVDLFISAKGKEFIARNSIDQPKFDDGISATLSKQRSSFDAANQSDFVDVIVTASPDAKPGRYPLTLEMTQKVTGGTNLVQQYLYINVG